MSQNNRKSNGRAQCVEIEYCVAEWSCPGKADGSHNDIAHT